MAAKVIRIDSVGISAIFCQRRPSTPKVTIRKFKASCGSTIKFSIEASGAIASIERNHELCKAGCESCLKRELLSKLLIESGK